MSHRGFFKGVGAGLLIGTVLGMSCMPDKKRGKRMLGKAIKSVGEVIQDVTDAIGW